MPSIRTVQVWGVLTKVATAALSVAQTAVVLRLLGPEAYGIVGVVISLGALVGVSQHVGVVDAAIREIAVAETPERRAAVFWVALGFRLLVTVPISVALALAAPWIATVIYPFPQMATLVRLMSVLLILFGIQGVLGGAYTGQRSFGILYLLQLVMAAVNVPLFAGLVWWHGMRGVFEASLLAAAGFSALLAIFLRSALGGPVAFPRFSLVRGVFADIVHTGVWTYLARILSVAWQRVPVLLLGRWASPETVGLFTAAITFGAKLQLLTAALGEVNLAFLSSAFARSRDEFRRLAARTLEDVGAVTVLGAAGLILFADVLVPIIAGPQYLDVIPLVAPVTWAYAAFAFLDIAANTVFVPARRANLRALSFAFLGGATVLIMLRLRALPASAATAGVLYGAVIGLFGSFALARARMALSLFPPRLALPVLLAVLSTALRSFPLAARSGIFLILLIVTVQMAFPRFVTVAVRHAKNFVRAV